MDALKRGEHRVALDRFEEAYALVPSPKIHYDFGLAYLGLGRDADALSAFERFLAEAPDAPADKRDKAARYVAELRARVGTVGDAPGVDGRRDAAGAAAPPPATAGAGGDRVIERVRRRLPSLARRWCDAGSVEPGAGTRRTVALSLGAAGVVLFGAGVTFGVLAKNESDSLSDDSAAGAASDMRFRSTATRRCAA